MNRILPKIDVEAASQEYGRFAIGPLEGGFGITLGNALRRVLLSSLPGVAVTSVRVSGVPHEFLDIPNVREDMTMFIINLKRLRLLLDSDDPVRLRLHVGGEGDVTAGDLECPAEVDIMNPELHLLTADSSDVDLEIECVVARGTGYSPAEERGKLPIGEIPVDAIFSPVRKTNYSVQRARVGQITDFDRLVVEIWTDRTILPQESLRESAKILLQHFSLVADVGDLPEEPEAAEREAGVSERADDTPIEDLGLSVRAYNCLKRAGITRVGEVLDRLEKGEEEMLAVRNFGRKSLEELRESLISRGLLLPEGEASSTPVSEVSIEEEEEEELLAGIEWPSEAPTDEALEIVEEPEGLETEETS